MSSDDKESRQAISNTRGGRSTHDGENDFQHGAVLTVRVWFDSGQFRARIIKTLDIDSSVEKVAVAARPEDVLAAIQHWLDDVQNQTSRDLLS